MFLIQRNANNTCTFLYLYLKVGLVQKVLVLRTSFVSSKIVGWSIGEFCLQSVPRHLHILADDCLSKRRMCFWPFSMAEIMGFSDSFFLPCLENLRDRFVLIYLWGTNLSDMKTGNKKIFKQGIWRRYWFSLRGKNVIHLVREGAGAFYTLPRNKDYALPVPFVSTRSNCYIMVQGILDPLGGWLFVVMSYIYLIAVVWLGKYWNWYQVPKFNFRIQMPSDKYLLDNLLIKKIKMINLLKGLFWRLITYVENL